MFAEDLLRSFRTSYCGLAVSHTVAKVEFNICVESVLERYSVGHQEFTHAAAEMLTHLSEYIILSNFFQTGLLRTELAMLPISAFPSFLTY